MDNPHHPHKHRQQPEDELDLLLLRLLPEVRPEDRAVNNRNDQGHGQTRRPDHLHVGLVLADRVDRARVIAVNFGEHGQLSGDGARVREGAGAATRRATEAAGRLGNRILDFVPCSLYTFRLQNTSSVWGE